jgi:butyrate kinase
VTIHARRQGSRIWAVLVTGAVSVGALVGCSASHEVGKLGSLRVVGNVDVLSAHVGSGSESFGPFTAGGKIDFEGTCIGKGPVTVDITGDVGEKVGLGCAAKYGSRSDSDISRIGGYTAVVAAHSTFSIRVKAPKATRWAIAVAASQH